jgi:hypothetical protein
MCKLLQEDLHLELEEGMGKIDQVRLPVLKKEDMYKRFWCSYFISI